MKITNKKYKNNYTVVKKFLKQAKIWQHWKMYILECICGNLTKHFSGCWYEKEITSDVIGDTNFTDFLEEKGFNLHGQLCYEVFNLYLDRLRLNVSDIDNKKWLSKKIEKSS